jgi:pimeloyl-ACP methyl ester carboxylesterase
MRFDYRYPGETQILDDSTRSITAGSFIQLRDGYTHYQLEGPGKRQVVVLVHGFSVPYLIWDPTFSALTLEGFRVLRYDLFGRGFSDRPYTQYNLDLFVRQLHDLLEKLDLSRVDLIGLSMGGAIASAYTVRFPDQVRKLALIDPIGTQGMPLSWLYKFAFLPGISELLFGLAGSERLVKAIASDFFDPAHLEMFEDQYRVQMKFRGFKRAILSTIRNKTLDGFPGIYAQLGKLGVPVQIFWGRNDQTVPFIQSRSILAAVPGAEFHIIEDCGHIPHYEKPEIVNPVLIRFLSST